MKFNFKKIVACSLCVVSAITHTANRNTPSSLRPIGSIPTGMGSFVPVLSGSYGGYFKRFQPVYSANSLPLSAPIKEFAQSLVQALRGVVAQPTRVLRGIPRSTVFGSVIASSVPEVSHVMKPVVVQSPVTALSLAVIPFNKPKKEVATVETQTEPSLMEAKFAADMKALKDSFDQQLREMGLRMRAHEENMRGSLLEAQAEAVEEQTSDAIWQMKDHIMREINTRIEEMAAVLEENMQNEDYCIQPSAFNNLTRKVDILRKCLAECSVRTTSLEISVAKNFELSLKQINKVLSVEDICDENMSNSPGGNSLDHSPVLMNNTEISPLLNSQEDTVDQILQAAATDVPSNY